jgi:ornithine cyclodeaminase/alanine dehydrogenase-like protein (mu-crystallin family)
MCRELGIPVCAVDTPRDAAEPADVLVTCTSASQMLILHEWLQPGVTVATLGRFEIEGRAYRDVDKVVVDDWEVARESEDMRALLQQGMFAHEDVYADMAAIVSGANPGRTSSTERILVRADGLVTQDVAICHYVYRRACEQGLGVMRLVG